VLDAPTAASLHARRAEAHARAAEVGIELERIERLIKITESNVAAIGKPISDRIYDLLLSNEDMTFSPAEIMECIRARDEHLDAVRKALHRLCSRSQIIRVGHGEYRINRPPREAPTP
jgi:hypothetical protein